MAEAEGGPVEDDGARAGRKSRTKEVPLMESAQAARVLNDGLELLARRLELRRVLGVRWR